MLYLREILDINVEWNNYSQGVVCVGLEKELPSKEREPFAPLNLLSTNLESSWTLVSGSPVSFVVPQRLTANTRPVLIRRQLITDCPASVLGKDGPPDEAISYGRVIISLLAQPSN